MEGGQITAPILEIYNCRTQIFQILIENWWGIREALVAMHDQLNLNQTSWEDMVMADTNFFFFFWVTSWLWFWSYRTQLLSQHQEQSEDRQWHFASQAAKLHSIIVVSMVLKIHSMITKAFTTSTTASSKAPWTSFLVTAGLSMRSLLTTHSQLSFSN